MIPTDETIDISAITAAIRREMTEDTNALIQNRRADVYWTKLTEIAASNLTHDEKLAAITKLNGAFGGQ